MYTDEYVGVQHRDNAVNAVHTSALRAHRFTAAKLLRFDRLCCSITQAVNN